MNTERHRNECEARYWISWAKQQSNQWKSALRDQLLQIEDKRGAAQPELRAAINRELEL